MLQIPKNKPLRDMAYRRHAREVMCDVPGCYVHGETGEVVLAHIRLGNAGMGIKPPDDESLWLCSEHHRNFDTSPDRCRWIVEMIVIPLRKGNYLRWKAER